MKIIYCIHSVYNPGGMERVLLNKVKWLCENTDWTIRIVTTDQHNRPPFFDFPAGVEFTDLGINYTEDNSRGALGKITGYLRKRRLHRHRLTDYLLKEKADIVISLFPSESGFIPSIKDGSRKILELHFNRFFRLQYGRNGLVGLIDRIRTKSDFSLASKFDSFVVLTEEDGSNWRGLHNLKVIPNAVRTIPARCSSLDAKRVIAVGRLDYQKGFDNLLKAWALMVSRHPELREWKLDIFGQGEWHEMLSDRIAQLGIGDSATIHRPSATITEEYLESSLLAMTSNYEGFGMVLVEAMACGVPCVAFACPCGPADIIEDGVNGRLVSPGDVNAFADTLAAMLSNQDALKRMGLAARESVTRFSESRVMGLWMDLFNSLLQ